MDPALTSSGCGEDGLIIENVKQPTDDIDDVLFVSEAQRTAQICSEVTEQRHCNHCDIAPTMTDAHS